MDTPPIIIPHPSRSGWKIEDLEKWLYLPRERSHQTVVYFLYYLAIIIGLLLIYGRGDFTTAPFVYQGF